MSKMEDIRILLIGKTGAGKSRSGNTILGIPNAFNFSPNPEPGTLTCQSEINLRFGKKVLVVDTPGVYHAKGSLSIIGEDIKESMTLLSPGPHVLVLCVQMGRFDKIDLKTLQYYGRIFGEKLKNHAIVVFTHYDIWEDNMRDCGQRIDLDQYIAKLPKEYKDFLSDIGYRYVVFNNKLNGAKSNAQAQKIFQIIDKVISANNGRQFLQSSDFSGLDKIEKAKEGIDWVKIGVGAGATVVAAGLILKFFQCQRIIEGTKVMAIITKCNSGQRPDIENIHTQHGVIKGAQFLPIGCRQFVKKTRQLHWTNMLSINIGYNSFTTNQQLTN